ncbi:MAG: HTTM domain-containing protein, partial [Polyangiaceae bacterium]
MSWAGFLYDTTIWAWLSWRKSRPYAFAAVVAFHAAVGILFDIGMFPFMMVVAATVFFQPDWPRRFLRRLPRTSPIASPRAWTWRGKLALGAFGVFALVQVAMPLRHHLYTGDVIWNEQGMRWSWKVMVREKNGAVTYHVTLPAGGDGRRKVQIVTPRKYLTDVQEREMSGQPDLILQLAHHIADDFAARGYAPVEVRAEARVSINGRRSRLLVDPTVDLTTIDDGVAEASWILPEPTEPPARLRAIAHR